MPTGDDQNLRDPSIHQCLDGVIDHGPVKYRHQMFVGNACQRIQTATHAPREDYTFHSPPKSFLQSHRKPGKSTRSWTTRPANTFGFAESRVVFYTHR